VGPRAGSRGDAEGVGASRRVGRSAAPTAFPTPTQQMPVPPNPGVGGAGKHIPGNGHQLVQKQGIIVKNDATLSPASLPSREGVAAIANGMLRMSARSHPQLK
jgi:hypothetical protein